MLGHLHIHWIIFSDRFGLLLWLHVRLFFFTVGDVTLKQNKRQDRYYCLRLKEPNGNDYVYAEINRTSSVQDATGGD